jgi:hypothetical protein
MVLNGKKKVSYDPAKAKPCQIGCYIYAHARDHTYNNMISVCNDTAQYMDTDSILTTYE